MHAIRGRYGREWVEHSDLVRRRIEDEGMRVMETPPADDYVLTGPELLGLGRATVVDHERVCAPAEVEVRDAKSDDESLLFHVLVPARHWWDDIVFT